MGYAFDRFLPYVTAGVAWTQLEASIGNPLLQSGSTTKSSFTVGGGVEYAFWQNLSAKVEYLYIAKLGDFTPRRRTFAQLQAALCGLTPSTSSASV